MLRCSENGNSDQFIICSKFINAKSSDATNMSMNSRGIVSSCLLVGVSRLGPKLSQLAVGDVQAVRRRRRRKGDQEEGGRWSFVVGIKLGSTTDRPQVQGSAMIIIQ